MSLKIKKLTGEVFDLPPDYVIESEKNNPLFSKKGSQTVSISFQNTNNNRKLLEHAYRLDKAVKPSKTIPVVVESGPAQQSGLMAINSASDKLISANIGWDESEMYTGMGNTLLKDIKDLPVFTAGGTSQEARVDAMLTHLTRVMKTEVDTDYYVFPIVLKRDVVTGTDENGNTYLEFLNDFIYRMRDSEDNYIPSNGEMGEFAALKNTVLKRYIDGKEVLFDVPKGYGVSPFLKVWRLLELIFYNYGLTLANNPFKEHRQLKRLVVLNNTIDAILTGRLYYKDMMPDITIKEFLDGLYNKFGMQYFVDSNTKSVSLIFWKDVLSSTPYAIDFTKYKTAPVTINYSSPKQLKLIANREIAGTEVKWKTFEEFLSAYEYQFKEWEEESDFNWNYSSIFSAYLRTYIFLDIIKGFQSISSDFFDWDKKDDLAYEEIQMNDLCLPIISTGKRQQLHYLVGYKHAYSDISISGETVEADQSKAKLAFAFGWGKTNYQSTYEFNYFFASQDNRNEKGAFINDSNGVRYDLSLTCHREDGLFNRWWKEYDAFLRHSNYGVDVKLKLPELEILKLKMFQTVFIDNQPLFPEQIKFKQNKLDAVSDCKFKTLRLYQPHDLSVEQKIEVYFPQKYYWAWSEVKTPDTEEEYLNQGISYGIVSGYTNTGVWIDEVEIFTKKISMMPPTEEEYQNQEKRIFTYEYVIQKIFFPFTRTTIKQTVTYVPQLVEY